MAVSRAGDAHFGVAPRHERPARPPAALGCALVAVALVVLFSLLNPSFFRLENFVAIGVNSTSILIAVLGTSALLIAGYVDLSIGSMVALIGIIVAKVAVATQDPAAGRRRGPGLRDCCSGCINGVLVRKLSISPLIVTLAMLAIYGGLAYVVSSVAVYGFPPLLLELGRGKIFGVQYTVLIAVAVFVVGVLPADPDGHRSARSTRSAAMPVLPSSAACPSAARWSGSTRSTVC